MKKSVVWFLLMGCLYLTHAQTITVFDQKSSKPLDKATITSELPNVVAVTDTFGKADISVFAGADSILIRHMRFKDVRYSYEQLQAMNFSVALVSKSISLEEVVVTSNRWERKKIEAPTRVEVINMKEAAFQNPQTAADLLGMSGYAFIQKSQLGGGSPMLRGMATNRVLLVIDGVRMNNAIFRSGNLQTVISLDANNMQGTEILFGPGSVKYGSDAIGGVMSFTTLTPEYSGRTDYKPVISGNAMARFSSANIEKTGHADLNIGLKNIAFTSSFSYSNYSDLRSGSKGGNPYFYRPTMCKLSTIKTTWFLTKTPHCR
jgi:hemoglobin/transferrin/lactoferrin receptor protein